MEYINFLSLRFFLRARGGFLSFMSAVSILGIVIGVAALITVMAVMNGFDLELRNKIIQNNPHILITSEEVFSIDRSLLKALSVKGVRSVVPFAYLQGFVRVRDKISPCFIRGIDITSGKPFLPKGFDGNIPEGNSVLIGKDMAAQFGLRPGDRLILLSPITGMDYQANVSGIFETGLYQYDSQTILAPLSLVRRLLFLQDNEANAIGIFLDNPMDASYIKRRLFDVLKDRGLSALTWIESNKSLFSALKLEKYVMFLILLLIVIVAAFNIVSSLVVLVATRTKEIAVLKALGLTNGEIYRLFLNIGILIGIAGALIGGIIGVGLSLAIEHWHLIRLPADVYYIDYLPAKLELTDAFLVIVSAISIAVLSSLYPSSQAARLEPARALRYE